MSELPTVKKTQKKVWITPQLMLLGEEGIHSGTMKGANVEFNVFVNSTITPNGTTKSCATFTSTGTKTNQTGAFCTENAIAVACSACS